MKDKKAFHDENRRRFDLKYLRNDIQVIEGIFFLVYRFTNDQIIDVGNKLVAVDRFGQIEIIETDFFLRHTGCDRVIIVILRNQANFVGGEMLKKALEEEGLTRSHATSD